MVHPLAQGLIFDLDGTLADTMPMHLESWEKVGLDLNVPITGQMILDRNGTPTYDVAIDLNRTFGWSLNPDEVQEAKNYHYNIIKKKSGKIRPIEHVCSIVRKYKNKLPMSVATGSIPDNAHHAIKDIGLEGYFITVRTAADVERPKPYPEVFLKCSEALQVLPSRCQVFEDGLMGFQAARSARMILTNVETGVTEMPLMTIK